MRGRVGNLDWKIWDTRGTRTWLVRGEEYPEILTYAAIESLEVSLDGHKGTWTCRYCQNTVSSGSNCPRCNAPKHSRSRGCKATICGWLPQAIVLDELEDDFTLEVLHSECGDPSNYFGGDVVVRIEHCKVTDKWMPRLDFIGDERAEGLALYLEVEGQVSFMPKERAWSRE